MTFIILSLTKCNKRNQNTYKRNKGNTKYKYFRDYKWAKIIRTVMPEYISKIGKIIKKLKDIKSCCFIHNSNLIMNYEQKCLRN